MINVLASTEFGVTNSILGLALIPDLQRRQTYVRNRNANFSVRISNTEKQQLDTIIQKCGLTKSAYIRMIISGYLPKETPPIEYHQVIKELNSIGNNLNQIAKIANSTGAIDKDYYMEQSQKLDHEIIKINKMVVVPERISFKRSVT